MFLMTLTKLKVDLKTGQLEVEGEESFVNDIYKDFKEKINNLKNSDLEQSDQKITPTVEQKRNNTKSKKFNRSVSNSFNIMNDLKTIELKKFFKEKSPSTAMEMNLVFVYFLKKIQGINSVTPDYIYTCYKLVGEKLPTALKQSIADTAFRKDWLDTKSMDDIRLTLVGENYVEHDLTAQVKNK